MDTRDVYFVSPRDTGAFTLAESSGKKLWRKELMYPGRFSQMKGGKHIFDFDVDEPLLDHWASVTAQYIADGHQIPLPSGHTTDNEKNRGNMVKAAKEWNEEKKRYSLYGYFDVPPEHEVLLKTGNVSIHSPPDFEDSLKRKYVRPIRHVALTDYPLIPGLGKFQTIVASLITADDSTENSMTMQELADALGVSYPDGADDKAIAQAIVDAFAALKGDESGEPDTAEGGGGSTSGESYTASQVEAIVLQDRKERGMKTITASQIPATVAKTVAGARKTQIESLVQNQQITPDRAKKLIAKYATDDAVNLTLSSEAEGGDGDTFDDIMLTLSDLPIGAAFPKGGKTGPQLKPNEKNPLITDAENRAKRK